MTTAHSNYGLLSTPREMTLPSQAESLFGILRDKVDPLLLDALSFRLTNYTHLTDMGVQGVGGWRVYRRPPTVDKYCYGQ